MFGGEDSFLGGCATGGRRGIGASLASNNGPGRVQQRHAKRASHVGGVRINDFTAQSDVDIANNLRELEDSDRLVGKQADTREILRRLEIRLKLSQVQTLPGDHMRDDVVTIQADNGMLSGPLD